MTGDGSADLVRVTGGGVTVWHYLGNGRWAEPMLMQNPPNLPFDVQPQRLFLSDIDGDGCADLIYLDANCVRYWINQCGVRFEEERTIDHIPTGQINRLRIADMRGSGTAGLLWTMPDVTRNRATYFYLDFSGGGKPYLLNKIDNGVGRITEVEYSTSAREAAGSTQKAYLPVVIPVVTRMVITDAATGASTTTNYRYHDGYYDGILREFGGFGRVDEDTLGDAFVPTLRTTTWFHNGRASEAQSTPIILTERKRLRAVRGRIFRQERYMPDDSPLSDNPFDRREQTWRVDTLETAGGTVYLPRLETVTRSTLEREPDVAGQIVTTNTAWDEHGNVTDTLEVSTTHGKTQQSLRTHIDFANDAAGRFLSRAWRVRQFDADDTLIADTITLYDGQAEGAVGAQGLTTTRSHLVLTDALVNDVYGSNVPDFAALSYFRRDDVAGWWVDQAKYERIDGADGLHGNVTNAKGAMIRFDFDANKTYPTRIVDPVGNETLVEHDYRICRVAKLTEASGATRLTQYDSLARLIASAEPGASAEQPTLRYTYETGNVPVTVTTLLFPTATVDQPIQRRDLFDGMGRLLEQRVRHADAEVIETGYLYGVRGLPVRQFLARVATSEHFAVAEDALHHTLHYDALGRLVRHQNADGSVRTYTYGALSVEERDEEDNAPDSPHFGTPTRRLFDATGRVHTVEYHTHAAIVRSNYEYDVKGNLITYTDALGNRVRFWYDLLGRTLRVERPEQTTLTVYDAVGNAVDSWGRDEQHVHREYDLCNRVASISYGEAIVHYSYHDAGTLPVEAGQYTAGGRCFRIDDESGTTWLDYDQSGRIATKKIRPVESDQTHEINYRYRADQQLESLVYPDNGSGRREVTYEYDLVGRLQRVPELIDAIEYDLSNRRTRVRHANGVEQAWEYAPTTQRLTAIRLEDQTDSAIHELHYETDLVGNIIRIISPDAKYTADYVYDGVYQLVSARTNVGESWQYSYDAAGNLTLKSDVGSYHYGENGAAATCLTSAGADVYAYTSQGQIANAPFGACIYDALGNLRRITQTDGASVDYVYNHSGERSWVHGNGIDIRTPDMLFNIEAGAMVLNLFDGQGVVARQYTNGEVLFLHPDHLGGLAVVTAQNGSVVNRLRYDPFGKVIENVGGGTPQPIGFTGGAFDSWSNLLYLTSRYYSPMLGRFISPDPIVARVDDPLTWASYTYCRNNPLLYVDPSGRGLLGILIGAVAIVGLVAVVVITGGSAAVIVGVVAGMIIGGVVGGLAAKAKGGDFEDIVTGALVGAAIGGWAALASVYAGPGTAAKLGLEGFWGGVVSGGINGAINGTGMGLTTGYAGGRGSLDDVVKKTLVGAFVGLVTGAILGALLYKQPSPKSLRERLSDQIKGVTQGPTDTADLRSWLTWLDNTRSLPGNLLNTVKSYALEQALPYATTQVGQVVVTNVIAGAYSLDYERDTIEDIGGALVLKEVGVPLSGLLLNKALS
jgi:RHS repeat-associated protein